MGSHCDKAFSVLIPLYYKENPQYLRDSVLSVVGQTEIPSEIVLVKEHDLPAPLQKEVENLLTIDDLVEIRVCHNPDLADSGLGAVLAYGVEQCRFPLIARMDSDDLSLPDRFERQLAVFDRYPETAVLSGTIAEFADDPELVTCFRSLPEKPDEILRFARYRNPFNQPAVMFKKQAVVSVGNYDGSLRRCEDYDLWFRMLSAGFQGRNVKEPLVLYRSRGMVQRRADEAHMSAYAALRKRMYAAKFVNFAQCYGSIALHRMLQNMSGGLQGKFYRRFLRVRNDGDKA